MATEIMRTFLRRAPKDSIIYRLNPATRIILFFSMSLIAIMFDDPVYLLVLLALESIIIALARISLSVVKTYVAVISWMCIVFFLSLAFLGHNDGHIYFYHPFGYLSDSNMILATAVVMKILTMSLITATFIVTTPARDVFYALKNLRVPYTACIVAALALRCLTIFATDFMTIREAQISRALDLSKGNIIQRLRKLLSISIPLMFISIKRMEELTNAVESRAFVLGQKRSSYLKITFKSIDYIAIGVMLIFLICIGILRYIVGYFTFFGIVR